MKLFAAAIAVAVLLGYLLGGRLKRFELLRLRWWGLAVLGLAIQQFAPLPEGEAGIDLVVRTAVLSLSYTMLVVFTLANIRLPGMPLVLIGIVGNFVVIAANGGMPVSAEALRGSGQGELVQLLIDEGASKHHLLTEDDVLTFLADVIALPQPIGQAISVGDVATYGGLIWLVASVMRGRIPSSSPTGGRYRGKHRRRAAQAPAAPAAL